MYIIYTLYLNYIYIVSTLYLHCSYRPMRSASMRETSYSRSIRRQRRQRLDSVSIRSSTLGAEEVNNNGHA